MDLTPHIPALIEGRAQVPELMQGNSSVACMGSRAMLSLFVCAAPFTESLMGAVTTEAEALELVNQHRPSVLFITEWLEQGDGLSLVQHGHRLHPVIELGSNGVVGGGIDIDRHNLEPLSQRQLEVLPLVLQG